MKVYRRSLVAGFLGALLGSTSIPAHAQPLHFPEKELSFVEVLLQVHEQTGRAIVVEGIPCEKSLKLAPGRLPQVLDALAKEFDFTWSDDSGILVLVQQFRQPESTPEISADEFAASLRDIQRMGGSLGLTTAPISLTKSLQSFAKTLPAAQQELLNTAELPLRLLSPEQRTQFETLVFQQSHNSLIFKAHQLEQTLNSLGSAVLKRGPKNIISITSDRPKPRTAIIGSLETPRPLARAAWPQESPEQPALITWGRFLKVLGASEGLRVAPELAQHPAFFIAKAPSLPLLRVLARVNGWQLKRRGEEESQELLLRRQPVPIVTRENLSKARFQVLPTSVQRFLSARYPEDLVRPIYFFESPSLSKIETDLRQKNLGRIQRGYQVVSQALGSRQSLPVADLTPEQRAALTDALIFQELEQVGGDFLAGAFAHELKPKVEPGPKPELIDATLSSFSSGTSLGFTLRYPNGGGFSVRSGIYVPGSER